MHHYRHQRSLFLATKDSCLRTQQDKAYRWNSVLSFEEWTEVLDMRKKICHRIWSIPQLNTPVKINIEPENDGLEDDFPFLRVCSQVPS